MLKCPRIYSTSDGESHFDEVQILLREIRVHPAATPFETSAEFAAGHIRLTAIPANAGTVDWHTVPERVLTVRLNGSADYETSDGGRRHVPAGGFILFDDTSGKGHRAHHSPHAQTVLWISLPRGLKTA